MSVTHIDVYTSFRTKLIPLTLAAWLGLALWVVASGALAAAPLLALPAVIGTLTASTLAVLWRTPGGRAWSSRVSLPALVWFHAWRVVPGAAFLVLYSQGALPWGFAVPGGVGDVVIALLAPLAAWAATSSSKGARAAFVVWSLLGALDLAFVVRAAFVLSRADPWSMHLLREMPLGLLPTFAVPLTFATHALALRRVAQG
jgi:hypothetical protein